MPYRTIEEMNYFGSDLNKFVHENCTKRMTVNNIDCVIYKASLHRGRLIESKHSGEHLPTSQMSILKKLAKKHDVYIVRGDYPFEHVEITYVNTGKKYTINDQSRFVRWLEFEEEL